MSDGSNTFSNTRSEEGTGIYNSNRFKSKKMKKVDLLEKRFAQKLLQPQYYCRCPIFIPCNSLCIA